MTTARNTAVFFLLCFGAPVAAHEFWVEPSTFAPPAGVRVDVRLCIADGYEGWSYARDGRRIERFVALGPDGERPILGFDRAEPAGVARLTAPGGYVLAYESNHAFNTTDAAQFDAFLKEKKLDRPVRASASAGKVREVYSRHAKALLAVGDSAPLDRRLGLRLELIAQPVEREADIRVFQLLLEGEPLADAWVTATRLGAADELAARTDRKGRVAFDLNAAGVWRVATVHLRRPAAELARERGAEWESLWASLTLETPPSGVPDARRSGEPCRNRLAPNTLRVPL